MTTQYLLIPGHNIGRDGKRSPDVTKGIGIYEPIFVRHVANTIVDMLANSGIQVVNIVPDLEYVTLGERLRRIKRRYETNKNLVGIELHTNAITNPPKWQQKASGVTTWFYNSNLSWPSKSEKMAGVFSRFVSESTGFKNRGIRNCAKEGVPLYLCKNTPCPFVLLEAGFHDNPNDARLLSTHDGIDRVAQGVVESIRFIEETF